MKKTVLWCITICAGAVTFAAGAMLVVLYANSIQSAFESKFLKSK